MPPRTKEKKPEAGDLYLAIASIGPVAQGSQLPGDDPAVQMWPAYFARVKDGQQGIDAASAALQADIDLANANRQIAWYGPKEPEPEQAVQVRAIQDFTHRGFHIRPGDLFGSDCEVVRELPQHFENCLAASSKSD